MLAVIFMWKPTNIAALIFLPRTLKSYKEKLLCLYLLKRWKQTERYNAVILFPKKNQK